MIDIFYFGYSDRMLMYLAKSDVFSLLGVFSSDKRTSERFKTYCREHAVDNVNVTSSRDLYLYGEVLKKAQVILMYKFEFIIPDDLVHTYRIFNFHGGDLRTNRGAHSVGWAILHQEKKTCLSVYQLTGGIDEGLLVDKYEVCISDEDDPDSLNDKLQDGIPNLLGSLVKYLHGERDAVLVSGGTYYRKIREEDYVIDCMKDSLDAIAAKIRSQKPYFGAVLEWDEKKYRIKKYELKREKRKEQKRNLTAVSGNLVITDSDGVMTLPLEQH